MNKRILMGAVVMLAAVTASVSATVVIDRDGASFFSAMFKPTATLPAVVNARYENECGACHFAYQPGWLPARSWKKMMGTLDDHFDENAELGMKANRAIADYLIGGSADVRPHRKSHQILASIRADETPLRISDLAYIVDKHAAIPAGLIAENEKVRSLANCMACHSSASQGLFDEQHVDIPGDGLRER